MQNEKNIGRSKRGNRGNGAASISLATSFAEKPKLVELAIDRAPLCVIR